MADKKNEISEDEVPAKIEEICALMKQYHAEGKRFLVACTTEEEENVSCRIISIGYKPKMLMIKETIKYLYLKLAYLTQKKN